MRRIFFETPFFLIGLLLTLLGPMPVWADSVISPSTDPIDVIVIDPGHGGVDNGAISPRGVREKDLTLAVAKRLAEVLRKKLGCTVILTRNGDTFLPLEERTALANSNDADIFISIHANSAPNRSAKGLETFFLNYEPSDEASRRTAALENGFDPEEAGIEGGFTDDLKTTLLDLATTAAHHESSALAESIHMSLVRSTGRGDRGVKQAPFTVLGGAVMPAILVELGFISNSTDRRWLVSSKGKRQIADSIALGIIDFKNRFEEGLETVGFRRAQ
ncbi:MAG: N-acetylmuramoyl-L-alanine amidase [Thermodesulfobacteriota bacterium]